jgi:hypothetical protein
MGERGPQGPPGENGLSALQIVDANDQVVGPYLGGPIFMVDGELGSTSFSRAGFKERATPILFWHISTDCSGERFIDDASTDFVGSGAKRGGGVALPAGDILVFEARSKEEFPEGSDVLTGLGGVCHMNLPGGTLRQLRRAKVADISRFVPPFRVK